MCSSDLAVGGILADVERGGALAAELTLEIAQPGVLDVDMEMGVHDRGRGSLVRQPARLGRMGAKAARPFVDIAGLGAPAVGRPFQFGAATRDEMQAGVWTWHVTDPLDAGKAVGDVVGGSRSARQGHAGILAGSGENRN